MQTTEASLRSHWQALFVILLVPFLCGALFSAYQVYETARLAVLWLGAPDVNPLPIAFGAREPGAPPPPNVAAGERVNVLILGVDRRPEEPCPCRTDSMMLATLDPKTLTAGLVTIPRDLYVPIPGIGESRINTAYFYGDAKKTPGGGPALAKKTVEYNLGRRVHYYVLVDFNGFRKVIDTLGGVEIDVPKPIDDTKFPDDTTGPLPGYKPVHIPAGHILMNGEMALEYARTRNIDNDFGRSKRQIQVLMAARDRALRLDVLPRLPGLLQSMWGTVQTDLTPQQIIALAQVASQVKKENIKTDSIDQRLTVQFQTTAGAYVLWWDRAKVGQLMDSIVPRDDGKGEAPAGGR